MSKKNFCTWTIGINGGRMSSPNMFERISRAAALHLRKFHALTISSSCQGTKFQSLVFFLRLNQWTYPGYDQSMMWHKWKSLVSVKQNLNTKWVERWAATYIVLHAIWSMKFWCMKSRFDILQRRRMRDLTWLL